MILSEDEAIFVQITHLDNDVLCIISISEVHLLQVAFDSVTKCY
jgi:hypothetical protein